MFSRVGAAPAPLRDRWSGTSFRGGRIGSFFAAIVLVLPLATQQAQVTPSSLPEAPQPAAIRVDRSVPLEDQPHPAVTLLGTPRRMLSDGAHILVSPIYLRTRDLKWILPLAGAAAAGFATDQKTMTEVVSTNPSFNQTAINVSDGLRDGFIAAPAAMVAAGQVMHNDHLRETGILGSEAWIDAYLIGDLVKVASFRERPLKDNGQGEFYISNAGFDSSFVSGHSMVAWSSAAAIAAEYPSKWVQLGVYTASTGVSLSRVLGQQHFPTDVLLGSAGGWLIGHYVVRAHHHARR